MKLSLLFISSLLSLTVSYKFNFVQNNFSNLSDALCNVIQHINPNGVFPGNLISSEHSSSFLPKDYLNSFLMTISKSPFALFRLKTTNGTKKLLRRKFLFVVLIVENFENFLNILQEIERNYYKFNGLYLIVFVNGEIPEVQQMFELLWKVQIFNVNLMYEDENGEILVKTFTPFTPESCNSVKPVLINRLRNGKFLEKSEKFYPEKMKNLHNCPIRVSIANNNEPYIIERFTPNGTQVLSGRDFYLMTTLAESLNFKIVYSFVGTEGYFYPNGTSSGPLRAITENKADMSASNWWLKENRLNFFDFSNVYAHDQLIFTIPPGQKLTALEKLIYPFQFMSWAFILLFCSMGLLIIFVMKWQSKCVQDFVIGPGVKDPYFNMFAVFVGQSRRKLPGKNFARYLLMMFTIYSMIIRTIYQGSFYQLMKSNKRQNHVQSLNEMVKKNFSFHVYLGNEDIYYATMEVAKR